MLSFWEIGFKIDFLGCFRLFNRSIRARVDIFFVYYTGIPESGNNNEHFNTHSR
jgi:hypothetical protein